MYTNKNDKRTALGIFFTLFLGLVIGTCASFLFHPKEETLSCNKNYECKYEKIYYDFLKSTKDFKISKKTLYLPDVKNHLKLERSGRYSGINPQDSIDYYHIYSDNQDINIKFKNYIHLSSVSAFEKIEQEERDRFEKYKENPENYSVTNSLLIDDRMDDIVMKSFCSLFVSGLIVALLFSIL